AAALGLPQVGGCRMAQSGAGELGLGLLRPERRSNLLEDRERVPQGRLCCSFSFRAPLDLAFGKQRAAELERHGQAVVGVARALDLSERAVPISAGCEEQ